MDEIGSAQLLATLAAPFLADPGRAGIVTDFDGTLAPIVGDPRDARPLPGAVEVLHDLADRYARVAVVSGRPLSFLHEHLGLPDHPGPPADLRLRGLYGLEISQHGEVVEHPEAEPWRAVIAAVARQAEAEAPPGVLVERKGLSVTLHYRLAPDHAPWVEEWTAGAADRSGLARHPARMSWELVPRVAVDKGTTVLDLAEGLGAVCFLGDDRGDLPAFSALDYLATEKGVSVMKVVVRSAEAPADLIREADLVVDGPPGALDVLRLLRDGAPPRPSAGTG